MSDQRTRVARRLAAGAAIVAVPLAGMQLYLKHQASMAAAFPRAAEDSTDAALAKLRDVAPNLVGYREVARFPSGVAGARGIAADSGGHVVVSGTNALRVVGAGEARNITLAATPECVTVAGGAIYLGFRDHVEVYDLTGAPKAVWPALPGGALLTGIAVGESAAYLADSGRRVVVRTDRAGKVLGEIGKPDPAREVPGILLPSPHLNVAVAADGSVWLNNAGRHRMENYSADGTLERFWGAYGMNVEGFVGCCNPSDFALLSDGSFVTSEKGVTRVKHYLPDGRFESFLAAPTTFAPDMTGVRVAAGKDGVVWVLDRGDGVVRAFSPAAGGAR